MERKNEKKIKNQLVRYQFVKWKKIITSTESATKEMGSWKLSNREKQKGRNRTKPKKKEIGEKILYQMATWRITQ